MLVSIAYLLVQYLLRSYCTPVLLVGAGLLAITRIVLYCVISHWYLAVFVLDSIDYPITNHCRPLRDSGSGAIVRLRVWSW